MHQSVPDVGRQRRFRVDRKVLPVTDTNDSHVNGADEPVLESHLFEVPKETPEVESVSVEETTCCVVGGGPAGVFLSYLLACNGVSVILLEAHRDFDRKFRGDTIHPSILENLD